MAKQSKFGVGNKKTIKYKGEDRANVTKEQLKDAGFPTTTEGLRKYMNAWNKSGKRPTANKVDVKAPKVDVKAPKVDVKAPKVEKVSTANTANRSRVARGSQRNTRKLLSAEQRRQRDAQREANRNKTTTSNVGVSPAKTANSNTRLTASEIAANQRAAAKEKFSGLIDAGRRGINKLGSMKAKADAARAEDSKRFKTAVGNLFKGEDPRVTKLKRQWYEMGTAERRKFKNQSEFIKAKLGPNMAAKKGGGMIKKTGMRGGGMVKKTGMRGGGMVKKTGMKKGGLIKARGAGKAQRGIRPAKMR